MRAVAFLGPARVDFVEVPVPEVTPGRVLLRTVAAGVCQTDLHLREGIDGRIPVGRILGHEIAGEIVELGDGVAGWQPGQQVAVYPAWSCGICPPCQAGQRNACLRTNGRRATPAVPAISVDGGMAEYVSVPASALVDIGPLDPVMAATMTDAALSPYGSIKAVQQTLSAGTSAVVIGLGGLGSMAFQIPSGDHRDAGHRGRHRRRHAGPGRGLGRPHGAVGRPGRSRCDPGVDRWVRRGSGL